MKKLKKKIIGWLKIAGLTFTMLSGTVFVACGAGIMYHASQKEAKPTCSQNIQTEESSIVKTEKNIGFSLMMTGCFVGLNKFFLTVGTKGSKGMGPTSKKLAENIKKVYENDIKEQ